MYVTFNKNLIAIICRLVVKNVLKNNGYHSLALKQVNMIYLHKMTRTLHTKQSFKKIASSKTTVWYKKGHFVMVYHINV